MYILSLMNNINSHTVGKKPDDESYSRVVPFPDSLRKHYRACVVSLGPRLPLAWHNKHRVIIFKPRSPFFFRTSYSWASEGI